MSYVKTLKILTGALAMAEALGVTRPAPLFLPLQPGQPTLDLFYIMGFALKSVEEGLPLLREGKIRKQRKRKLNIYSVQVTIVNIY